MSDANKCGILSILMEDIEKRLDELGAKLDAVYVSVEKTRKYFQIIMWVTVILVVLPANALVFVIPAFISSYMSAFEGLI